MILIFLNVSKFNTYKSQFISDTFTMEEREQGVQYEDGMIIVTPNCNGNRSAYFICYSQGCIDSAPICGSIQCDCMKSKHTNCTTKMTIEQFFSCIDNQRTQIPVHLRSMFDDATKYYDDIIQKLSQERLSFIEYRDMFGLSQNMKEAVKKFNQERGGEITGDFTHKAIMKTTYTDIETITDCQNYMQCLLKKLTFDLAPQARKFIQGSEIMEKLSAHNITTLIANLERKMQKSIKSLKLVYKYDPQGWTRFQKLDDKADILMIIRLVNQYVVGGYTHEPLNIGGNPGVGFIFSFSSNKQIILEIKQGFPDARVITPNRYQIIFGNSQLKLEKYSKQIVSNVGIPKEYFDSKSQKISIDDFLGPQRRSRKIEFQTYEFYQIEFS